MKDPIIESILEEKLVQKFSTYKMWGQLWLDRSNMSEVIGFIVEILEEEKSKLKTALRESLPKEVSVYEFPLEDAIPKRTINKAKAIGYNQAVQEINKLFE